MELASTWQTLADRGIMFWAATGAVALGVTLILAAGIVQFRRMRHRSQIQVPSIPEIDTEASRGAQGAQEFSNPAITPEISHKYSMNSVAADSRSDTKDRQELHLLLARLRAAADRLEEYHHTACATPAVKGESPLKESSPGVDYLFRAGTG